MLRPIILFLKGNGLRAQDSCEYQAVATEDQIEPIPPHLHPLLIPLVIQKIASNLPVNDLLNFRRVCHAWNTEAIPLLQKRIHHLRVPPKKMREFLRIFSQSPQMPMESLALYVDQTEHMMLFQAISVHLTPYIISLRLNLASQEIPNIPHILQNLMYLKELILYRIPEKSLPPSYRKYETLEEDLQLPTLKSLSFRNSHPNQPFICNYDNFIVDIINSAENLTHLEFQNWKSSLQQILRFVHLSHVSKLIICGTSVKESEVATLKKKCSKLENLKITLGQNIREETLLGFFESLEATLEVLDVTCDGYNFCSFPITSKLPHLKSLRFQGWKSSIILDDFSVKFPLLKSLELIDFRFIGFTDYKRRTDSLVERIVAIPCVDSAEMAEVNIASLVTAFPNVRTFRGFHFTDAMCDVIFKYWRKLQHLSLEAFKNITDYGLTGIPLELLWRDSNGGGSKREPLGCQCDHFKEAQTNRINNYIGNLTELQTLILKGKGLITNASLHYGILELADLIELQLPSDDDFQFRWCVECMASKLKKIQILHVNSNEMKANSSLLFLKDRIPNLKIASSSHILR